MIRAGVLILALVLAGCGSFPPRYPAGLPALVAPGTPAEECTEVAGRYVDRGTSIRGDGVNLGPISMTSLLNPTAPDEAADTVEVRTPGQDIIEVESFRGQQSVALLRQPIIKEIYEKYRSRGYACTNGFVPFAISVASGTLAPLPVGGFAGAEIWLRKAVDGSLIVLEIHSSGGVVGIVPWGSREITWHRFAPMH